jgi:hypothetical protein
MEEAHVDRALRVDSILIDLEQLGKGPGDSHFWRKFFDPMTYVKSEQHVAAVQALRLVCDLYGVKIKYSNGNLVMTLPDGEEIRVMDEYHMSYGPGSVVRKRVELKREKASLEKKKGIIACLKTWIVKLRRG